MSLGPMFDAIQSGGTKGEASWKSREVWGVARPPNGGDGREWGDSQWIIGDGTISGDGQGWVDVKRDRATMRPSDQGYERASERSSD